MLFDELQRQEEPKGGVDKQEHRAKIALGLMLLEQADVSAIAYTRDKYAAFDILLMSAGTRYAIEFKERSSRFGSTDFSQWWLESDKVGRVMDAISKHPSVRPLYASYFSGEDIAFLWPLYGFTHTEECTVQASARTPEIRAKKKFACYPSAAAHRIRFRA